MLFKKLSELRSGLWGGQSVTDCATLCVFLSSYAFTAFLAKKKKKKVSAILWVGVFFNASLIHRSMSSGLTIKESL